MKKAYLSIFLTLGFLAVTASAQTTPVQITGGRFFITARSSGSSGGGTALMQSNIFTSTSSFTNNTPSAPWDICQDMGCKPGRSFIVPNSYALVSDEQHHRGTFTINGVTYDEVFFSRGFSLSRDTFMIPRIARRKGLITLQKSFTLEGSLKVCQVSDFASECPADKVLFDGLIGGHGTLTITMRIKVNPDAQPQSQVYLKAESFDYQFEQ